MELGIDLGNAKKRSRGLRQSPQPGDSGYLIGHGPSPGHHKWCPSGLQDWSPVPEGNSDQGLGTGALALTRRGPEARRFF